MRREPKRCPAGGLLKERTVEIRIIGLKGGTREPPPNFQLRLGRKAAIPENWAKNPERHRLRKRFSWGERKESSLRRGKRS